MHSCYDHCPHTHALINTGALERPGAFNDSINVREALHLWFLDEERAAVPAWNHTHVGCWNGFVAYGAGRRQPDWCRKPECGPVDKMHHDTGQFMQSTVRNRGWRWQLDS